jgi:hypothetical protein
MSKAARSYIRTAPVVRAFSLLAELVAAAAIVGGGSVLTAFATLA